MNTKRIIALILVVILTALTAFAVSGGADDPLISLSYLDHFLQHLSESAGQKHEQTVGQAYADVLARLEPLEEAELSEFDYAGEFTPLALERGGTVAMDKFACVILTEGTARLTVTEGEVINISDGTVCTSGQMLVPMNRYFAAEDSCALVRVYSDTACIMVDGFYLHRQSDEIPLRERFIDVGTDHWAGDYIFGLAEMNIVNGVGDDRFEPESAVTRAAFVTILGRLGGADLSAYSHTGFVDADISQWYGPYVAWAADAGVATGYGNGEFMPDRAINREEMALMMTRFADSLSYKLSDDAETPPFSDAGEISEWAFDAVERARLSGLMNGRGDNCFVPSGTATRAEICAVVCRLMTHGTETEGDGAK